jgi:hypothetical protein
MSILRMALCSVLLGALVLLLLPAGAAWAEGGVKAEPKQLDPNDPKQRAEIQKQLEAWRPEILKLDTQLAQAASAEGWLDVFETRLDAVWSHIDLMMATFSADNDRAIAANDDAQVARLTVEGWTQFFGDLLWILDQDNALYAKYRQNADQAEALSMEINGILEGLTELGESIPDMVEELRTNGFNGEADSLDGLYKTVKQRIEQQKKEQPQQGAAAPDKT